MMTAHNRKMKWTDEQIAEAYRGGMSGMEIARHNGVYFGRVYWKLKHIGVPRRTNSESHIGLQTGERNPFWHGGRRVDSQGYVVVRINGREVREHRHLMEKSIGRKLRESEVVHHINGDKTDNRLENLELLPSHSEHVRAHHRTGGRYFRPARAALAAVAQEVK